MATKRTIAEKAAATSSLPPGAPHERLGITLPPEQQQLVNQSIVDSVTRGGIVYADSLIHMAAGPFVSKFSLGSQNPTGVDVVSAITVVMPTGALLDLATNILNLFAKASTLPQLETHYQKMRTVIESLKDAETSSTE